jgi:hypothetical protein
LRPPRESESSPSAVGTADSSAGSAFAAAFFARFGVTASTGAAWKIGTGIDAAFLRVFGAASPSVVSVSTTSEADSFFLLFFTARLRGDFGSIAMAPNPLINIKLINLLC